MTILNKSTLPELQITNDETYDSPNMTGSLSNAGLWLKHGGVVLDEGGISVSPGATVSGLVTPASMATALLGKADASALSAFATTASTASAMATKADVSAVKRIDTYTGNTDTGGLFTVTYATAFSTVPTVQPEPPAAANQTWVKVSSTVSGFSFRLVQRNSVNLLATELLLATTVNVAGAAVRANVIAA